MSNLKTSMKCNEYNCGAAAISSRARPKLPGRENHHLRHPHPPRAEPEAGLEMGELNLKSQIAGFSLQMTFLLFQPFISIVFDCLASGKILSSSRVLTRATTTRLG